MSYDYKSGKQRIKDILNNRLEVKEVKKIPCEDNFTFDNSYYTWVTAIFVDIRNSTDLFGKEDKVMVSKIVRSFTSEVIEVLRACELYDEIGIRGDCVYAIYSSPTKDDTADVAERTYYINTLFKMLNKLFEEKRYSTIKAGIGISTAQELIVKAGRKGVDINSKVWIGNAVTKASKLSSLGNKGGVKTIVFSDCTYVNIIENLKKADANAASWFTEACHDKFGKYYHADIIKTGFDNWISGGMKT